MLRLGLLSWFRGSLETFLYHPGARISALYLCHLIYAKYNVMIAVMGLYGSSTHDDDRFNSQSTNRAISLIICENRLQGTFQSQSQRVFSRGIERYIRV